MEDESRIEVTRQWEDELERALETVTFTMDNGLQLKVSHMGNKLRVEVVDKDAYQNLGIQFPKANTWAHGFLIGVR